MNASREDEWGYDGHGHHPVVHLPDGRKFDETNAPPWFDNYRPGNTGDPRWRSEARVNRKLNDRGDAIANAVLWGILGLLVVVTVAFVVSL